MSSHVLQVSRSDGEGHILVNVQSGPRNELDVQIEATEGTSPFVASYKHHQLAKALTKQGHLTEDDWEIVVRALLLQTRSASEEHAPLLQNLELSAHIAGNKLVLAFRKNISGIQQRIAELSLNRDDDHELDTLAWVSTAVQRGRSVDEQFQTLQAQRRDQDGVIRKLQQQLEELVRAKAEHEEELLEKLGRLLNAKKLKIRNQQRMINDMTQGGASTRALLGEAPTSVPSSGKSAASKQSGKRKMDDEQSAALQDDEGETTDVTEEAASGGQATPERSEDEASEEDDLSFRYKARRAPEKERLAPKPNAGAALESVSGRTEGHRTPPRRELPFGRGTAGGKASHSTLTQEAGGEAGSDDEL